MPAPHCSVVFASADSVLRFIDPRKPGLQVRLSPLSSSHFRLLLSVIIVARLLFFPSCNAHDCQLGLCYFSVDSMSSV